MGRRSRSRGLGLPQRGEERGRDLALRPTGSRPPRGTARPPGSYQILPGETPTARSSRPWWPRFDTTAAAARAHLRRRRSRVMTPYQVVTVASVVQKEGIPSVKNMGPVARVIDNRLQAGTPLQMNSTVLYSLGQDGGAVTSADLKLPPPRTTPTCTPDCLPPRSASRLSMPALKAAVNPTARVLVVLRRGRQGRDRRPSTPTPSSWPTSSWRPAGASVEMTGPCPDRPGWPSAATTVVGVIGQPVAHSLSPRLHHAAFAALGLDWVSVGFPVPSGAAAAAVGGDAGVWAWPACRSPCRSRPRWQRWWIQQSPGGGPPRGGQLRGPAGRRPRRPPTPTARASWPPCGAGPSSTRRAAAALVLGAGGAARAVGSPSEEAGAAEVTVWNPGDRPGPRRPPPWPARPASGAPRRCGRGGDGRPGDQRHPRRHGRGGVRVCTAPRRAGVAGRARSPSTSSTTRP